MSEPQDGPLCADDEPALDETPRGAIEPETPVTEDEPGPTPSRGACRTELRGWAGAHLHGAVRPRRRAARRGRPPSRWC
jgi:hypothetical protein